MSKEAKAQIKINKLLEQSGWRFLDSSKGFANIQEPLIYFGIWVKYEKGVVMLDERNLYEIFDNFTKVFNGIKMISVKE